MKKNNMITAIRQEAKAEAEKDFAADWGPFWKVAGSYIGQYAMAALGFAADFAVAFSLIYSATRNTAGAFLSAFAICAVIQYGYGGATFRITKAVKNGRIAEGRYMRSAIVGGLFGAATLGASLYLSFHFDSVFEVASEPNAKAEMKDEGAVNAYYDAKISALRDAYETERNGLATLRETHRNQRNEAGEILWTSRRTLEKIETQQLPALRRNYDESVTALEKERAQRLQQVVRYNDETTAKWGERILQGGAFTRWFNISINLLRVFLIIGYAVFLLDVYKDEEDAEAQRRATMPPSAIMRISNPPIPAPQFVWKSSAGETLRPATPPLPQVANSPQPVSGATVEWDVRNVAHELAKARNKARAYRSKIKSGKGNDDTNRAGLASALREIEALEAQLKSK